MRPLTLVTRSLVLLGWLATLAALAVVQLFGDRTPLGTLAMYAPRHLTPWPWLLPLALSLVVSRRLLLASAAGFLVTLVGVANFSLPLGRARPRLTPPAGHALPRPLRLVTYNTDGSAALAARVAQDARAWDADMALLIDCKPEVAAALRTVPGARVVTGGFFCLLTRHEVLGITAMPPAITAIARAAGSGRAGRVHRVDLRVHGTPVTLYPLHLETPRTALWAARRFDLSRLDANRAVRAFDSRVATRFVDREAPGLLVLGDFNLDVNSAIYRRDWGDLTNAWSAAGLGFGHTMFAGRHRVRIDHVLLGPGWTVDDVEVLRGYPSEHQPVVVTVHGNGRD
jgi:vancomycin resistance protein VanJ